MNNMPVVRASSLSISHLDGDTGYTFDVFRVNDESGTPVVDVKLVYSDDGPGSTQCSVIPVNSALHAATASALLPGVHGSEHLLLCVLLSITHYIDSEHEFYLQSFYDECGNSITRPLLLIEFK